MIIAGSGDASNSDIFRRLWCEDSQRFFALLVAMADNVSQFYFSVHTDMPVDTKLIDMSTLISLVQAPVEEQFDFDEVCFAAESQWIDPRASDFLFFSIADAGLGRHVIPEGAMKVLDQRAMAITLLHLTEFSNAACRVLLPKTGELNDSSTYALYPYTFSREEWSRLKAWSLSDSLIYDFDVQVPRGLLGKMQFVLSSLQSESNYTFRGDECDDCLQWLLERGFAHLLNRVGSHATWSLTTLGKNRLCTHNRLRKPTTFLTPRPHVLLAEQHSFELLMQMEIKGWRPGIALTKKAKPYEPGSTKTFWIAAATKRFQHSYFLALLLCDDNHKKPVPAFKTNQYYTDLIAGRVYQPRSREKGKFNFDCDEAPIAKRRKQGMPGLAKAKHQKRKHRAVIPKSESSDASPSSSSDSSSTSSSSTNASSASSKESHRTSPVMEPQASSSSEVPPLHPKAKPIAVFAPRHKKSKADDACVLDLLEPARDMELRESTWHWRGFRFTTVFDNDGNPNGWEASCIMTHEDRGDCRKRLAYGSGAAADRIDLVERTLKFWCLQCGHVTRVAHRDTPMPDVIPSHEAIEATQIKMADSCKQRRKPDKNKTL